MERYKEERRSMMRAKYKPEDFLSTSTPAAPRHKHLQSDSCPYQFLESGSEALILYHSLKNTGVIVY